MSDSIHGHQLMEMMAESGKCYTKAQLLLAAADKFGEQARFHTCFGSDLTALQLIDFLAENGKFLETESGFSMPTGLLC